MATLFTILFTGVTQSSSPPFENTAATTTSGYQHPHHQLVPVSVPSMIPKIEEWSNGTPYGVTPPTQVTPVNVDGLEKNSPSSRNASTLHSSAEEVCELYQIKIKSSLS